jgi:hypothetical protein
LGSSAAANADGKLELVADLLGDAAQPRGRMTPHAHGVVGGQHGAAVGEDQRLPRVCANDLLTLRTETPDGKALGGGFTPVVGGAPLRISFRCVSAI